MALNVGDKIVTLRTLDILSTRRYLGQFLKTYGTPVIS